MTKKNTKAEVFQSQALYDMQAEICGALASPVRLQILDMLFAGEKTSAEILEVLDIPKANLSQHLSVLKDAGVVQSRKEGLYQYISLSVPQIKEACFLVKAVLVEKIKNEEKKNLEVIKKLKAQR